MYNVRIIKVAETLRNVWGGGASAEAPPPQKIFKIWIPEMAFAAF